MIVKSKQAEQDWSLQQLCAPHAPPASARPRAARGRHQIQSPKRGPKESAQGRLAVNSEIPDFQILVVLLRPFRQSLRPQVVMGARPHGGKQPRSARGVAALLACGPTKKSGEVRRAAKHASPVKRLCGYRACGRRSGPEPLGPVGDRVFPRGPAPGALEHCRGPVRSAGVPLGALGTYRDVWIGDFDG
jgi:hypothetical protein